MNGHPRFSGTATFLSIISDWWKLVNTKSKAHAKRKRDVMREVVTKDNLTDKTSFLRGIVDWLVLWEEKTLKTKNGLSKETFQCAQHTTAALADLFEFVICEKKFEFFIPGKAQSDPLESRFGKSRQMSGGNLYASVRQFLEADKSIRIKNLAKLNLTMSEIKNIFTETRQIREENVDQLSDELFVQVIADHCVEMAPSVPEAELNILFYVSGRFGKSMSTSTKCGPCKDLIVSSDASQNNFVALDSDKTPNTKPSSKSDYLDLVNRGGLTVPSELAFLTCAQALKFYNNILQSDQLKSLLHSPNVSSKTIFQHSFIKYLDSSEDTRLEYLSKSCSNGHLFSDHVYILAGKMFNLFSKNFVSVINSEIHRNKGRKTNEAKRVPVNIKVAKLQSEKL